ncbi:MAG TPA: Re/Si-specific NAD(P)(+) transhydrogenase subunit alpha [Polyangiaceae bacterium]|nr:Re/Si-specific NAD(P)(+) transhydrogenase subunit alpha [Polyangiaceae bacterium]
MRIAVRRETGAGERRVSIVPESVKRLAAKKIETSVESGAGAAAFASDDEYRSFGARVDGTLDALLTDADAVVQIRPPRIDEVKQLKEGSVLVSLLFPLIDHELVRALAARKVTAIAVDMIPRTTVAQMMDVLSSQATAAGYEAVLMAAVALPKFFPMLMTAAGTIAPARVLILGAGVAGLQAIGTARRLGAVVEAFDVRKAVKEQVESLGAKFVEVETEDAATAGGYAKELSEEAKKKQAEAIARHVAKADVVICTALIPGRRAPVLVTADMVATMKAGGVIVDLAAEQQGNCELTKPGQTVVEHGVTIIGVTDMTSRMCADASKMYSRNMEKLLFYITKDGAWKLDFKDEIVAGSVITHQGEIVHPKVKELVSGDGARSAGAA